MAIVARCCLHTMYEFTAFMNMWAVESLGVSGGVAAQVGIVSCWKSCRKPSTLSAWPVLCMLADVQDSTAFAIFILIDLLAEVVVLAERCFVNAHQIVDCGSTLPEIYIFPPKLSSTFRGLLRYKVDC